MSRMCYYCMFYVFFSAIAYTFMSINITYAMIIFITNFLVQHGLSHDTSQWFKKGNGLVIMFKLDSDNPISTYNILIIFINFRNTINCNLLTFLLKAVFTKC